MKTTKKQFKSIARDILVLLANEDVLKRIDEKYVLAIYRALAVDYALNFEGANIGTYKMRYNYLEQFLNIDN